MQRFDVQTLIKLKEEKKLTYKQIAYGAGFTSANIITNWIYHNANPSYGSMCKLADFFDVSLDYFRGGYEE